MKRNEGTIDRIMRIIAGLVLLYLATTQIGWVMYVLLAVGIIVTLTGAIGYCGLYSLMGWNTRKAQEHPGEEPSKSVGDSKSVTEGSQSTTPEKPAEK